MEVISVYAVRDERHMEGIIVYAITIGRHMEVPLL